MTPLLYTLYYTTCQLFYAFLFKAIANVSTDTCTYGNVRLAGNGNSPQEGIVQVCYNGNWVYICDDYPNNWVEPEASVICKQLGYPHYGMF